MKNFRSLGSFAHNAIAPLEKARDHFKAQLESYPPGAQGDDVEQIREALRRAEVAIAQYKRMQ